MGARWLTAPNAAGGKGIEDSKELLSGTMEKTVLEDFLNVGC